MPTVVHSLDVPSLAKGFGDFVKRATIDVAERALQQEVGRGFDRQPVVITDGVPRRDYAQVKPFGRIEFARRPNMVDAVLWALEELRRRSPVKTGAYVQSHTVMINGAQIVGDVRAALSSLKETDRVQIVNPALYAKKIEGRKGNKKRGVAAMAGLSRQAPRGVYERVVLRSLVARFGRSMFFDFKYVKLDGRVMVSGYKGGGRRKSKTLQALLGNYRRARVQRELVYPALQFFIKPTGLPN